MGHGSHPEVPKVPDWRIYRVEDAAPLKQVEKALALRGLKDPWLRNEVWRYTRFGHHLGLWGTLKHVLSKGFKYGLVAGTITAALDIAFLPSHHHDDEGHH